MRENLTLVILVVMLLFDFAVAGLVLPKVFKRPPRTDLMEKTEKIGARFLPEPKTNLMERIEKAEEVVVKAEGVVVENKKLVFAGRECAFSAATIVVYNEALNEYYYLGTRRGDLDDIRVGDIIQAEFDPKDGIGAVEARKKKIYQVYQMVAYKIFSRPRK